MCPNTRSSIVRRSHYSLSPAVAAVLLCVLSTGTYAGAAANPIANGGAKVIINFQNPIDSMVTFSGEIPLQTAGFSGASVFISVGPFQRSLSLDQNGQAVRDTNFFEMRNEASATVFSGNFQVRDLDKAFGPLGLTNTDENGKVVQINIGIFFNDVAYAAQLDGMYYAKANQVGKAYYGAIKPPDQPFKPVTKIKTVKAKPNPIQPGQTTYLMGDVSLKDLTGDIRGLITWGDGSGPLRAPGAEFVDMLKKEGIAHTYTEPGCYTVKMMIMGANEIIATKLFVLVGDGFIVNSGNGQFSQLQKDGGGTVTLNLNIDAVPDAVGAETFFKDKNGLPTGIDPDAGSALALGRGAAPNEGVYGFTIQRVFTQPGIFVAETNAVDGNGNVVGKVRKTITVSAADLGMSMVPASKEAANGTEFEAGVRAEPGDSTITLDSMKGKFLFTSSKLDKVTFTGTIALPAGFQPKNPAGNDITIAMGNVIDTIHLSDKKKLELPTATGRVTRFRIVTPKLANGIAVGGEEARVNITLNVADLDVLGFDSEGIQVSVRSDEEGISPVSRFIQVDMLIQGQTFSTVVPVEYKLGGSNGIGSITGRR